MGQEYLRFKCDDLFIKPTHSTQAKAVTIQLKVASGGPAGGSFESTRAEWSPFKKTKTTLRLKNEGRFLKNALEKWVGRGGITYHVSKARALA
ncbi:hypothetical protein DSLASN_19020 [Desulfoluna limicola]|uniref:Uncharacterized protein n=1 Tax=Desulfoluna limicola TaxID=2810562 RepID=A0ABN6F3Q0_9BACT|nr:hypothetical protein DSLASN_19020 [Desulfoluna limicola]